ncbi:MAG: cyclic nucleotide-binding domain-containing protein [Actinomycetota bacterium]|nr:cyclic nucleotide-binding domain-containing protein [Acidimicrobiia bacterium]MDQ3294256.1 cyclic nucleotide-binding domain-containing protein [Actinomycetota bacterium]
MAGRDTYLDQLASIKLFSALSRKELQRIAKASDEVKVKAGHELVRQGEVGREMFVIVEGEATVKRNGRKVATLGPGGTVGEFSLLDKGPRTATVVADTDATVLVLGAREFTGLLDDVPGLAHKVLAALAGVVRDLDAKVYG